MEKNFPPQSYGLLGYPIKHSLSPLMHNAAFKALGLNAEYRLFELRPENLKDFPESIKKENIRGFNVTFPYKEGIISFLEDMSGEARLIGAVNTVKVLDNQLKGFNTDGEGFLRFLSCDMEFDPKDKNIAILGAGGAAKAIAFSLAKVRPTGIAIYDLDSEKAAGLIRQLKENFQAPGFKLADNIEELNIEDAHILINATPVGMRQGDPCLVDEKFIHAGMLVVDLIYNPPETKLLKIAKNKDAQVANGLGMLLYQGVYSFEIWTDQRAPISLMREALIKGAEKL